MARREALPEHLARLGIHGSYKDGFGKRRDVPQATLRRIVDAAPAFAGSARSGAVADDRDAPAPAVESRCYQPPELAPPGRCWGLGVQLYSLRSARNWGIGDFTDLAALGAAAAAHGADFLAVNPLHARSLATPELCSPYSPTSRLFLDPLYIDPAAIADFGEYVAAGGGRSPAPGPDVLARLRDAPYVDYPAVTAAKLEVFAALYRHFRDQHLAHDTPRARAFGRFRLSRGAALRHYAQFEAARLAPGGLLGGDADDLERLHCYLQWLAEEQLALASRELREAGMTIGLYRDLALGPDLRGAEAADPGGGFVGGVSAGAPPDAFNSEGQYWNVAVADPWAMQADACRGFAGVLAANMRYAGALRIDHVMSLSRLFWIPQDRPPADGTYVDYPFAALAETLARASRKYRCLVVGEDLGTVPADFRAALGRLGTLGCRVLWFERDAEGRFLAAQRYPRASVASATTHDLPTIQGFWVGRDIALRSRLGLYPDAGAHRRALAERSAARAALAPLLNGLDIGEAHLAAGVAPRGLCAAVHALLGRTTSMLCQYQLEDVLEMTDAVNVPGSADEQHPNWRRKLPIAVELLAHDPRLAALGEAAGDTLAS